MLSMKKCTCGETTFKLLIDVKLFVACTKCGTLFCEPEGLPELQVNPSFQLRHV